MRVTVGLGKALLIAVLLGVSGCADPGNVLPQSENTPAVAAKAGQADNAEKSAYSTTISAPASESGKQNLRRPQRIEAKITRVVDGDTMVASLGNKQEKIRLLLVDSPETVNSSKPVEPFGREASNFAKDTLNGKSVQIELDVSGRDKYGRLLCYLWIGDHMFNEMLLEKGLARVAYVFPPNVRYIDQFRHIQEQAQKDGIGIWSFENYVQIAEDKNGGKK